MGTPTQGRKMFSLVQQIVDVQTTITNGCEQDFAKGILI